MREALKVLIYGIVMFCVCIIVMIPLFFEVSIDQQLYLLGALLMLVIAHMVTYRLLFKPNK